MAPSLAVQLLQRRRRKQIIGGETDVRMHNERARDIWHLQTQSVNVPIKLAALFIAYSSRPFALKTSHDNLLDG